MTAAIADTDALRSSIRKAGAPPLPYGAGIANALETSIGAARVRLTAGRKVALQIPTGKAGGADKAATLGRTLTAQSAAVGRTFIHLGARFGSQELNDALDQVPTCALVHG